MAGSGPSLALLVAEELQKLSAFDASASVAKDKIKIWHQVINRSVQRAFPMASFEAQFDGSRCRIRGFGPSWFSHFDSKVSQLLATPVFRFCLDAGDGPLALRYLGLGAEASLDELRCCEKLLQKSLPEAAVAYLAVTMNLFGEALYRKRGGKCQVEDAEINNSPDKDVELEQPDKVCLIDGLKLVKEEFIALLQKWCQEKCDCSLDKLDGVVLADPVRLFTSFQGYYLANRKEARIAAQAEAEKKQKAQEKKDAKEQQQKEKEERKRIREEKKQEKKQEQLEKKQKKLEKTNAEEKKQKEVPTENQEKKEGEVPKENQVAAASANMSPASPNQTMPGTPKRPSALIVATPRQKSFVKRRRVNAADAAAQSKPGASAAEGEGKGEGGQDVKAAKQAADHVKVMKNYQLLMAQPDFAKDVAYVPSLDANKPGVKSFTAYPYEQGKSKNGIGVLFYRPAFYVRHANISEELLAAMRKKGVNAEVGYDGTDGCSLGWSRFKNVMQAWGIAMIVAGWIPSDQVERYVFEQAYELEADGVFCDMMSDVGFIKGAELVLRMVPLALLYGGIPCESYGFMSSGTRRRAASQPWGHAYCFVFRGNVIATRFVLLAMLAIVRNCLWMAEQPDRSFLIHLPPMQVLFHRTAGPDSAASSELVPAQAPAAVVHTPGQTPIKSPENKKIRTVEPVCLRDLFQAGWDPNLGGMHKLLEEAIVWLKSVEKGPLKCEDFPDDLQSLLLDFSNLTKSASDLDALRDRSKRVMAAARANVEQRVRDATLHCERLPNADEVLEKRKVLLGTWLKQQEDKCKEEENNLENHHSSVRTVVETKLMEVINWAFKEWKETPAPACLQSDEDLMADLDAGLQALLQDDPMWKPGALESSIPVVPMQVGMPTAAGAQPPTNLQKPSVEPEKPEGEMPTLKPEEKPKGEDRTLKPVEPEKLEGEMPTLPAEDAMAPTSAPQEPLPEKSVVKRVIVPKGADSKITHNKVNIFDPEVCKKIKWGASETTGVARSPEATPEVVPPAGGDPGKTHDRTAALEKEFKRQDTSDLATLDTDTPIVIDGITYYKRPKTGELETVPQRQARRLPTSPSELAPSWMALSASQMEQSCLEPCRRSASMKAAYDGELVGLLQEADTTRAKMEAWYALRLEDENVVGEQLNMYETLMAQFDSMMTKTNGSTKLVKNAIVWVSNPSCGQCRLLHVYAHLGELQSLDFLLTARADPTERAKDPKQRAALHFAVKAGHDDCAKRLLEGKALAHDPDKNRETPLQIAAYGGFTSLAQLLLSSGAVVNAADRDQWTPLICAARAGHVETVELLWRNAPKCWRRIVSVRWWSAESNQFSGQQAFASDVDCHGKMLMTVHQKEKEEAVKISRMIVNFAACTNADVLVMGSTGLKEGRSNCFQRTTLGSSAHLAALEAPCSVVLIRPGCRVDPKLATVFMVAVDGSLHSQYALQMCTEWARPDKDEIVCRVFGPSDFTEPVERMCTDQLQAVMRTKKVEYAVIPTELDETADVHGDDLSDAAKQCRFRQQAFLVFGARGRRYETSGSIPTSPTLSPAASDASPSGGDGDGDGGDSATTLGHVARWCIKEAQCSLIIARPKMYQSPTGLVILRAASLP
eukprot:s1067_g4.t1